MATAKVTKGQTIVELTLTEREAKALTYLTGWVSGDYGGPRGATSNVYEALLNVGIDVEEWPSPTFPHGYLKLPDLWPSET